jgi:prephenate dehydrogenase
MIENLTIAGLGLLGGSIALAAREHHLAARIVAVGRRDYPEAVEAGLIDVYTRDLAAAAAKADLLILCTPVDKILEQLPEVLSAAKPGSLITDVGSTKRRLVEAAQTIPSRAHFVGSHPMVGSHLTGWQNAEADLFTRGITYITPTEKTDTAAAARVGAFWQNAGARTVYIHPRRHDRLCSLLSHVPHMAAVALMELIAESREDPYTLRVLAGTGLRDTTRIAQGSADVWTEICQHNSEEVAAHLEKLAAILASMAEEVRVEGCGMRDKLEKNAELRRRFNV